MNFVYVFIKKNKNAVYFFVLIACVITCIISLSTDLIVEGHISKFWGPLLIHGILFFPAMVYLTAIPFIYSFYLLIKYKQKSHDIIKNKSITIILTGTIIAYIFAITFDIIIPFVIKYEDAIQFGSLPGVIDSLFIFIALTKYRFMKIGVQEVSDDLFSNIRDGIMLMDSQGKIIQINKAI